MSQYKKKNVGMKKKVPQPYAKKKYQPKNLEKRITKLEHADELKYHDVQSTVIPLLTAGNMYCLCFIAQGDDVNERVGEEITAKYLNMVFRIRHFANLSADVVRIVVFWDKQTNGVGPTAFTSTSTAEGLLDNAIINSTYCPHNYRTKDRYVVLYDKRHIMNPDSTGVNLTKSFKFRTNLGGARIKYSGTGAVIGDLPSRGLFVLVQGSDFDATTSVLVSSRLWFTDS